MSAITSQRPTKEYGILPQVGFQHYDVEATTSILAGALVAVNAAGNVINAAVSGCKFAAGVANSTQDNTLGIAGDKKLDVKNGVFYWKNGDAFTKANVNDLAYVSDDQTVVKAVTGTIAGVVVDVHPTDGVAVATIPWLQQTATSSSNPILKGSGTLVAGTATILAAISATSAIQVTMEDPGAGAITGFAALEVPAGTRIVGTSFVVNAIDDAKVVIATAVSTFDWTVVG
jgi:hypothetical protein